MNKNTKNTNTNTELIDRVIDDLEDHIRDIMNQVLYMLNAHADKKYDFCTDYGCELEALKHFIEQEIREFLKFVSTEPYFYADEEE